jgi:beta-mannosidase
MPHPSLVLWNGGNENLWGHVDWGWEPRLDGKSWGHGYYTDVLPRIVAELDPGRAYCPGSPWSPHPDRHPNDPDHGTMHIWDVWNQRDYPAYREHRPRFAAEFGWQGPPTWPTLTRALSDDPLTPESPGMLAHQKAIDGNSKLTGGLVAHFRVPDDMDDWHWAMSLNQARAVQVGVEHLRALAPRCAGSILWQLNDCWPVTSWAAIDGDGRRKPVFYALRHAYADRLVTLQPRGSGLLAALVNDTDETWTATATLGRRDFDGTVRGEFQRDIAVPPRTSYHLPLPTDVAVATDPAREVVVVRVGERRALWFFAEDRDLALPRAEYDASARAVPGGYEVLVAARTVVRDLALLADKVDADAVVDDMLVTLLPGETTTITVRTAATFAPPSLVAPTVLRCANQLVAGPGL